MLIRWLSIMVPYRNFQNFQKLPKLHFLINSNQTCQHPNLQWQTRHTRNLKLLKISSKTRLERADKKRKASQSRKRSRTNNKNEEKKHKNSLHIRFDFESSRNFLKDLESIKKVLHDDINLNDISCVFSESTKINFLFSSRVMEGK